MTTTATRKPQQIQGSTSPAGGDTAPRRRFATGALRSAGDRVLAVIAVLVLVLVGSAAAANLGSLGGGNPIAGHPAPPLFPAAMVQPLGSQLAAQQARADQAFASWSTAHRGRDDAAFTAFAISQLPPPANSAIRARELDEVRRLAAARTPYGVTAATWLELYGKTDVWKIYRHDYAELRPAKDGDAAKAALKDTRTLTKAITGLAQARFSSDAPFITDPTLRPDKSVSPGSHKLSYPSAHAVYCFSAQTLLTRLDPLRRAEYTDMADQVAYSRLYMAGHYRDDLVAGAFLGDLIGDYVVANDLS